MASAMIGNLAVSLTMNTAAFQRGATLAEKRTEQMRGRFAAATTSVKGLGAAIGVGLGADVLYRITSSAFEMASSLSEAAEQAGVTVEGLQELRFAAEQTGVGADTVEAAMKRLSRSLGDLQRGKTAAVAAFAEIGLSADDLRGKSPDQALRLIADALNKIPDASQRVAIGSQLMGRSFSDLLPLINGGSTALDQYAEASRANGQISTEDAARLDELADKWGVLKTRVGVATAQIISDVIPMAQSVGSALDATKAFFFNLGQAIRNFDDVGGAAIRNFVSGVTHWIGDVLEGVWDRAMAKVREVEAVFKWLYDRVIGHSWVPDLISGIDTYFGRLGNDMVRPAEIASARVSQTFKQMADDTLGAFSRLTSSIKSGGFLSILEGVIGLGLQLGSVGAFGSKIATRINAPAGTGGYINPPRGSSGGGATVTINPSPYFEAVVDTRIGAASPSIAQAGARGGVALAGFQRSRSLA